MTSAGRGPALAALLLLAGCDSSGNSTYGNMWVLIRNSVSATFKPQRVTRDQASDIPYASLGWQLGHSGNQFILVLATNTLGERLWTSQSHIVLVTRDGRLVRSVGLPHDLGRLAGRGSPELPSPADAVHGPFRSVRDIDLPDLGRYGIEINCISRAAGRQTISILGRAIATVRIDETCDNTSLDWHFVDQYWVDSKDGTVWRSRQHIHPDEDYLQTEIFRPPG